MHKRRKFILIYPQFQIRLVIFVALILLFSNAIMLAQIYLTHHYFVGLGQELRLPETHSYFAFLATHRDRTALQLAGASLLSIAISIFVLVHLSHRIAGPIVKLKSHLRRAIDDKENVGELRFRRNDFFADLPALINEFIRTQR